MENKRYGVQVHLIEQLKRFQIGLKRKRINMAFCGYATISITESAIPFRANIQALNGRLSIVPFPLHRNGLNGFKPPQQELHIVDATSVRIFMDQGMFVTIAFDDDEQRMEFEARLGSLNTIESSSSSGSSSSPDRES